MSRFRLLKALLAVLALVFCTGTLQATATLAGPASVSLTCVPATGPTSTNVPITLVTSGAAVNVTVSTTQSTLSSANGGPLVLPSTVTLAVNSTTVATNFAITFKPGCTGTVPSGSLSLTFTPATGTALVIPVTVTITQNGASPLVPSPASLSFTCNKTTGTISPSGAQTIGVTSAATGGTPFTIASTGGNAPPGWLTISAYTGGTATGTAIPFTVTGVGGSSGSGCATLASGTTTYNIHLVNAPSADKVIPVSVTVAPSTPLSASVSPVPITYVTGTLSSGYAGDAQISKLSSASGVFFQVNLATVPSWLSVSPTSGIASSGNGLSVTFQPASGVAGLNVGNYTANVHLQVSGYLDFVLPVSIQVNNATPTLSILQGTGQTVNWIIGTSLPTVTLTALSSDAPIAFTVSFPAPSGGGSADPLGASTSLENNSGLAYNFGSPFTVSFTAADFATFAPGTQKVEAVELTSSSGSTVTFNITLVVEPQTALINSVAPAILPTSTAGQQFTVTLNGSGFVTGGSATVAGIVTGSPQVLVEDSNIAVNVQNTTSIVLTITVPSGVDAYLPFTGNGGTVTLGVCNPANGGTICSTPTGTSTLTIGINPILSAVTSAASYIEATAPALPTIAPYDILSIFGANFCISSSTGCTSPNPTVMYGIPSSNTYAYPLWLSPDAAGATQRKLSVSFYAHPYTSASQAIATAPLLFASNGQINLLAPSALSASKYVGTATVDIVVSFGYGTGSTMLTSQPYTVSVAATDPGVFTLNGDGEGDAAALAASYALITQSAPAIMRTTATDSDTILLYVSGLGAPDSDGTHGTGASANCMNATHYYSNVESATSAPGVTSDDGMLMEPQFYDTGTGITEPCFQVGGTNIPSVTIAGQPAVVQWAGWVQGAVAGLYQINVQLPSSTPTLPSGSAAFTYASDDAGAAIGSTTVAHVPVVITAPNSGSVTSQPVGVNLWVLEGLLGTATGAGSPSGPPSNPVYTFSGAHGTDLSGVAVVGTEGVGPYSYAVASTSTLPSDLTLNDDGTITGTPGSDMEGTTNVTFTVTDSNGLTGNVTISFVIS